MVALAVALFASIPALAQHKHERDHRNPNNHHHHRLGPRCNCGKTYCGKTYKHWCYDHRWRGYTHWRYYKPYNCTLYWSPHDKCWYWYSLRNKVYVPCDHLCTFNSIPHTCNKCHSGCCDCNKKKPSCGVGNSGKPCAPIIKPVKP